MSFIRISFGIKRYGQFRLNDFGKTLVFLAVLVDPEGRMFQEWRPARKKRTLHCDEVGMRPIDQNFTKCHLFRKKKQFSVRDNVPSVVSLT